MSTDTQPVTNTTTDSNLTTASSQPSLPTDTELPDNSNDLSAEGTEHDNSKSESRDSLEGPELADNPLPEESVNTEVESLVGDDNSNIITEQTTSNYEMEEDSSALSFNDASQYNELGEITEFDYSNEVYHNNQNSNSMFRDDGGGFGAEESSYMTGKFVIPL